MKYAVELAVFAKDSSRYYEPVIFDAEECMDLDEFDDIVQGNKHQLIFDFETDGAHRNDDGTLTEVYYTRCLIDTDLPIKTLQKLVKREEADNDAYKYHTWKWRNEVLVCQ